VNAVKHYLLPLTLCLAFGCTPVRPPSSDSAESQKFAAIVRFYREACPTTEFDDRNIHFRDGPRGDRLHIRVPVAVEAEFTYPFSAGFLEQQSKSRDGLTRLIATDLSYLRRELLFTKKGARCGCGGPIFDCTMYVVRGEPVEANLE
jgi:hypothetical protein